ncbi:hypothetical protein GCM10007939_25340 [Amylibacter marinus]|uniref:Rod shape-determining protein MreD n=1 Tax=Amylibacter marinus TaxID=1475483 RepID=A0ABQ5VY95_9RHOB|nr:hypothetical protein [Amylibacter marinus]GLQ36250.1 hypothetical protein GCM10007939_25340 [Amylibacter marinus]
MDKASPLRIASMRLLFIGLCFMVIFMQLIPISMTPQSIVWPDVILLAALALVIRRPSYVPFWALGIVFLLCDFLLSRPLGLNSFLGLIVSEMVRRNRAAFREMVFLVEWASVAGLLLGAAIAKEALLFLTFSDVTPWFDWLIQLGVSILCYPLMVITVSTLFWAWKSQPPISKVFGRAT